jgi:hypothetical protein
MNFQAIYVETGKMKSRFGTLITIGSMLLFSASLSAGIINLNCISPHENSKHAHQYNYNGIDTGHLGISEQLGENSLDSIHFTGSCDLNTEIHITKEVTNNTNDIWTSYILTLGEIGGNSNSPGECLAEFVLDPAPISTVFQNISFLDAHQIIFTTPDSVLIGETVTFEFSILVSSENINFCLDQTPVPEPLTIALLGFGGLCIRKKK